MFIHLFLQSNKFEAFKLIYKYVLFKMTKSQCKLILTLLLTKCFNTYVIALLNIFCIGNFNLGSVVNNTINLDKRPNTYSVEILQSVTKSLNFEDVQNETNNGNNNFLNVNFSLFNCFKTLFYCVLLLDESIEVYTSQLYSKAENEGACL